MRPISTSPAAIARTGQTRCASFKPTRPLPVCCQRIIVAAGIHRPRSKRWSAGRAPRHAVGQSAGGQLFDGGPCLRVTPRPSRSPREDLAFAAPSTQERGNHVQVHENTRTTSYFVIMVTKLNTHYTVNRSVTFRLSMNSLEELTIRYHYKKLPQPAVTYEGYTHDPT